MHVRFSTAIGMPVTDDLSEEAIGTISDVLIHPDTAKIEGFFVNVHQFLRSEQLFLGTSDILHFGNRVRVRDEDVLSPVEDRLRLRSLLEDGRLILGQRIITESGRFVGMCRDVQFETKTFLLEWLFPRRFFRWGKPIPRQNIVQVRLDAVVVRDLVLPAKVTPAEAVLKTLEPLTNTTPASRVARRMHRH
ncbi:MAG TPA: PRC-barrel domain-containing protein [Candidatus Peribacteraceae bacterium]|nr:PRC-barrel domain-containing protein [Candidatus Peribacteraceae bacterium]